MATQTTILGSNSVAIAFSINSTYQELMSAIDAVITSHGWTQTSNTETTLTYHSLCADGVTYKKFKLTFASNKISMNVMTEDEVNSTEPLLNYANFFKIDYTNKGVVYIFISSRWCAITVKKYGELTLGYSTTYVSMPGCYEIARDNAEDTVEAGASPFCLYNCQNYGSPVYYPLIPKTKATGTAKYGTMTLGGMMTSSQSAIFFYSKTTKSINPWTSEYNVYTPIVTGVFLTNTIDWVPEVRGRMFGLKFFTRNTDVNNFLDNHQVKVDNAYFSNNDTGVLTDHFYIPIYTESASRPSMLLPV
jgi:hypothetical protein